MTHRRAAAWMLGFIVFAMMVAWMLRPAADRAVPRADAKDMSVEAPAVRPQSVAPGVAEEEATSSDLTSPQHRAKLAALQDYRAWLAERLAAEDTARSLALAVHLLTFGHGYDPSEARADLDPRVPRWLARARAIAGDDGVAWAMLVSVPGGLVRPSGEFTEGLVLDWAGHDPHNLAPWLYLPGDAVEPEAWLERARSPHAHFTLHWLDAQAVVLDAYRRYPPPPEMRTHLPDGSEWKEGGYPFGLADPIRLPAFQRVTAACRTRGQRAHSPLGCAELGRVMITRSDSLIASSIGTVLARDAAPGRALPPDLRAEQRRMRWVWERYLALDPARTEALWSEYLAEPMPLNEEGVFLFTLEREGVRTTPPAGWNPPDTR